MKGKWAQGIRPRNFSWVISDSLAVCERPGGYGDHHRRVRRQEEIIWIRENGFDVLISLIPASHNLHNYDDLGVTWFHHPYTGYDDDRSVQAALYTRLADLLASGKRVLVHRDEMGDHLGGLLAGYLRWSGLVPDSPRAVSVWEQLVRRQLGPLGRRLVASAERLANERPPTETSDLSAPTRSADPVG